MERQKDLWWEFHMVSDLQIIFPFKWVKAVVNGLRESARVNHERCRVFDHKNCSTESPGHFAYNSIYRDVGKNGVKFVQSIFGGSHVERPEAGRYIWINRTCAGAHEDERVYKYAGDILAQGPQSQTATTTTRKEKARHSKDLSALLNPTRIWGASKQPKGREAGREQQQLAPTTFERKRLLALARRQRMREKFVKSRCRQL